TTRSPAWIRSWDVPLPRSTSVRAIPSPRSTSSVRGCTASARDSCTRSGCRSTIRTPAPSACSCAASVSPVGPAPTTSTSGSPLAAMSRTSSTLEAALAQSSNTLLASVALGELVSAQMRVAALYDVHGNLPALEAVLSEVERQAAGVVVGGGDVDLGPMPRETLDRLIALQGRARFIRGNTDRELVSSFDGTSMLRETVGEDDLWARRCQWAAEQITGAQRDCLASLPETVVLEIECLGETLFCHGSPRSDEEAITRLTPETRLQQ